MELFKKYINKKKSVILYAAGGHAAGVYEILKLLDYKLLAYVDKKKKNWLKNYVFLEEKNFNKKYKEVEVAIGLGGTSPLHLKNRLKKLISLESLNKKFLTLIHPKSIVSTDAKIEQGVVIMPGAIVRNRAKVEKYSIINTGCIIEHDVVVKKGSHIAPGATMLGESMCGECSMIGSNSVVLQQKKLGKEFCKSRN